MITSQPWRLHEARLRLVARHGPRESRHRQFGRWVAEFFKHPFARRPAASLDWLEPRRSELLLGAMMAIRLAEYDRAAAIVEPYVQTSICDAACLNMLGVIHEARQQWKLARKFYGKAVRADRSYAPAQQNLRRLYELHAFGRCRDPIALGDESPDLWRARNEEVC